MSLSVDELVRQAAKRLAGAGIESAYLDSRVLMEHVLQLDTAGLIAKSHETLSTDENHDFDVMLERRLAREPIALILGHKEFWGLSFEVSPDTLVPRPDSETLIEAAVDALGDRAQSQSLRILDLGTGTGCLLLSLLHELPSATGVGCDISQPAVTLATRNARRLGLSERSEFVESDWTATIDGTFDLVISNPPYIAECEVAELSLDVSQYEPERALVGGKDGLDAYRVLAKNLPQMLNSDAIVVLEVGHGQAEFVQNLVFSGEEMRFLASVSDLAGIQRCVVGQNANASKKRVGIRGARR